MCTRDVWLLVVMVVATLLACKAFEESYTKKLTQKLSKDCVAVPDTSLEKSEDGIVISCKDTKALEAAKVIVRADCDNIKSHGFKLIRGYETSATPQIKVKGTVGTGCLMLPY